MISRAAPLQLERSPRERAEIELLGGVIARGHVDDLVALGVTPEAFFYPGHTAIWESVCALAESGRRHFADDVAREMARAGTIERLRFLGGAPYLHSIAVAATGCGNLSHWARLVKTCPRCGK